MSRYIYIIMSTTLAILAMNILASCGILIDKKDPPKGRDDNDIATLEAKYARYNTLARDRMDSDGFIETSRCDSLLFSALLGAARRGEGEGQGRGVFRIDAAERNPGEWLRRPESYPECYASGESRSSISKDMLIGVILYYQGHPDKELALDKLQDLWYYGRDNNWFMGTGRSFGIDTFFGLVERSLLARTIKYLGGPEYEEVRTPLIFTPCSSEVSQGGTDCHLTMLYILLATELRGGRISPDELVVLESAVRISPNNPMFLVMLAKYGGEDRQGLVSRAARALLDERIWPADRLPDSADRCDGWIVRRHDADSAAYRSCPEKEEKHSGGDFLFVSYLLLDYLGRS